MSNKRKNKMDRLEQAADNKSPNKSGMEKRFAKAIMPRQFRANVGRKGRR